VRGNGFRWVDFKWLAKGGGLLGGHASAGHFNMGQKLWFWGTLLFGLSLMVSGLILDFPVFGQGRPIMEWAHFSHGITAVLFIGSAFAHSYSGYVDANWAKEHHDLWYAQMEAEGKVGVAPGQEAPASPGSPETAGG
jgi:formate dehydrogenase subunit gamma